MHLTGSRHIVVNVGLDQAPGAGLTQQGASNELRYMGRACSVIAGREQGSSKGIHQIPGSQHLRVDPVASGIPRATHNDGEALAVARLS